MRLASSRLDYAESLARLDRVLHGVDVDDRGEALAIAGTRDGERTTHVQFDDGVWRELAVPLRLLDVRWLSRDLALGIYPRSNAKKPENAYIIDRAGNVVRSFSIGDAVHSVVVYDTYLLVAYFDEGDGSPPPSNQAIALLDLRGTMVWSVNKGLRDRNMQPAGACDSMVREASGTILALLDWAERARLVRIDPRRRSVTVLQQSFPPDFDVFQAVVPAAVSDDLLMLRGEYHDRALSLWSWNRLTAPQKLTTVPQPGHWPRTAEHNTILLTYETHTDLYTYEP